MVLRYPRPLGDKEWEQLMKNLERGPTQKQIKIMKESEKWSEDIKNLEQED